MYVKYVAAKPYGETWMTLNSRDESIFVRMTVEGVKAELLYHWAAPAPVLPVNCRINSTSCCRYGVPSALNTS